MNRLIAAWNTLAGKRRGYMREMPKWMTRAGTLTLHYVEHVTIQRDSDQSWISVDVVDSEGNQFELCVFATGRETPPKVRIINDGTMTEL